MCAMKIGDVKVMICQQGLSDALMAEFLRSLRRVPGLWSKGQHCFLLGEEIAQTDYAGAVQLIEYGLQHFAHDTQACRLGYEHLARVHRANLAFDAAKACYDTARRLLAAERGQEAGCAASLEALFALRNELDRTDFAWSADLEALCREVDREEEILFGMRGYALTLAMADCIIAEHAEDEQGIVAAREQVRRLLTDAECTDAERMFRRHGVDTRVSLTEGEAAFLRRTGLL